MRDRFVVIALRDRHGYEQQGTLRREFVSYTGADAGADRAFDLAIIQRLLNDDTVQEIQIKPV